MSRKRKTLNSNEMCSALKLDLLLHPELGNTRRNRRSSIGNWTDCKILTPSSSDYNSPSFSFCWTAQPGVLRAQALCWELGAGSWVSLPRTATRTPTNWLQPTRTLCGTGLYNCLTCTWFLWASHLHRIQPIHGQGYILISSTECTCFLVDGWVEAQYVLRSG